MSFGLFIVLRNTPCFASRHPVPLPHLPMASVAKRHEYGGEIDKINNIYKLLKPRGGERGSMEKKDTYVYKLVRKAEIVYIGITNDLERREQEHREDKQFDEMHVIKGPYTREDAEKVESIQLRLFSFIHSHLPEYNQTCNGK